MPLKLVWLVVVIGCNCPLQDTHLKNLVGFILQKGCYPLIWTPVFIPLSSPPHLMGPLEMNWYILTNKIAFINQYACEGMNCKDVTSACIVILWVWISTAEHKEFFLVLSKPIYFLLTLFMPPGSTLHLCTYRYAETLWHISRRHMRGTGPCKCARSWLRRLKRKISWTDNECNKYHLQRVPA